MIKRKNAKLYLSILATGILFALNGCGDAGVTQIGNEVVAKKTAANEKEQQTPSGEYLESCILQEDEQYFYFCGSCCVSKVDKGTGEEVILSEQCPV